jgi:DNA-binding GntR family transcriptional regulator
MRFPSRTKSNKDIAYETIRDKIINGEFIQGQPIPEELLSKIMRMSRTPVREALIKLQAEDLVKIINNKGAIVSEITPIDIAEIFQLRLLVEPYATRICVEFIDRQALKKIKENLILLSKSDLSIAALRENRTSLQNVHDLHYLIVSSAGNRRLIRLLNTLQSQILWALNLERRVPGRIARSIQEHLNIVDGLLVDDGVRAEKHMQHHLESNMADLLNVKNYKYLFKD